MVAEAMELEMCMFVTSLSLRSIGAWRAMRSCAVALTATVERMATLRAFVNFEIITIFIGVLLVVKLIFVVCVKELEWSLIVVENLFRLEESCEFDFCILR